MGKPGLVLLHKGFTLIEILIVMLIISIVGAVTTITFHINQRAEFENIAHQITRKILLAEEEAILLPATIALTFNTHSFQFYKLAFDSNTKKNFWQPIKDLNLGLHALSNNVQLDLKMGDETVTANRDNQIIITTSGDLTPFKLFIGKYQQTPMYQVIGYANGEVFSEPFLQK